MLSIREVPPHYASNYLGRIVLLHGVTSLEIATSRNGFLQDADFGLENVDLLVRVAVHVAELFDEPIKVMDTVFEFLEF